MTDPVIIVGAGLGGLRTAESLRAAGYQDGIVVIGNEPHLPYNRPPLSKEALAGGVRVEDLLFRRREASGDVEWRLGVPVVASDLTERTVTLADGQTLPFRGLVIASGIRPRQLPIPGPEEGRVVLRNADDAAHLRGRLVSGERLAILGSGFIGCEVAATARALGVEVDVIALDDEPMIRPLGSDLGAAMKRHHEEHGVRFHLGRTITEFLGDDEITSVRLDDGADVPATVVLEAVGSVPNIEWLEGNGLDLSDGVLVDESLQVVGSPAPAVAVGDIARHPNALLPFGPSRIEHWNMPTELGKHAGTTLAQALHDAGTNTTPEPFSALPSFWSDQYDVSLQSFGMPGLGTPTVVEGELDGACIVEYHRGDDLVGVVGVNRSKDLMPYRKQMLARQP
ncbi:MAG: FAD-dependent oxidoreductase [Actinomycetota bacterium]|nr:FAD-dependent oxidoreductase [Actinomycetota bacterium]